MTRVEKDKYSVLIRGDYLTKLPDRDKSIQDAITAFLSLSSAEKKKAVDGQRVRITRSANVKPDYYMWLQYVNVSDSLVEDLKKSVKYSDLDRILNAAIKLWLRNKGQEIED